MSIQFMEWVTEHQKTSLTSISPCKINFRHLSRQSDLLRSLLIDKYASVKAEAFGDCCRCKENLHSLHSATFQQPMASNFISMLFGLSCSPSITSRHKSTALSLR